MKKSLFTISQESESIDTPLETHQLSGGWQDTLVALIEKGPLADGDIPSKSARDDLITHGYAAKVILNGGESEESNVATYKGRDLYIQLVFGTASEHHTLEEAIEARRAQDQVSTEK